MQKKLRILSVTFAPGRHGVSIDVQRILIETGDEELLIGSRETVETNQEALTPAKGEWGDDDVARIVAEATVEVEPAVEAVPAVVEDGKTVKAAVKAKAAVTALRFPNLEIVF